MPKNAKVDNLESAVITTAAKVKSSLIPMFFFCAVVPTTALSETLVGYTDDGTRYEASDEPCKVAPYKMSKNSNIYRILADGVVVTSDGCWEWADGSAKLHIKLWGGGEYFIPASEYKSAAEAEALHAQRVKEKRERDYIASVYKKAALAKAEAEAAKVAKERERVEAAKPKTWISSSKYGRVVLTEKSCNQKFGGNIAYVTKPDHEMKNGCWQHRDANIVVTVDGKEYMYTPEEFSQQ